MQDADILRKLEAVVGTGFPYVIEDGRCVELCLTSDEALYHGLIRHHPAAVKQDALRLVCQLTCLRRLNLRRNLLKELPTEFAQLVELEHLNLGSNYLGGVPASIRKFRKLRYLHLGNNDLTDLPGWIGEFDKLEYIALHKNLKLKSIANLRGLRTLKTLNLYFVNLLALPEVVYEFRDLTTLTLWNINRFPNGLESFQSLEFFTDCGGPGIRALPPGFTKLKRLRMARLFQNNLEFLPEDIGELENLEQISLYQNQLSLLPDSMARLTRLTKLNLAWNRFEFLPAWLAQLEHLEWLGMFENPIREPDQLRFRPNVRVVREWPFSTVTHQNSPCVLPI